MIGNYLQYVKSMRKNAIKDMRKYRDRSLESLGDWEIGFYAGHAQAASFVARRCRRLQKSFEAHIKYASTHSLAEAWQRFSQSLLL